MSLIERFKAGKYIKLLKSSGTASPQALTEARTRLVSMGPTAIQPVLESLVCPEARRPAMDVLASLLNEETLPVYLQALGSPEVTVVSGVTEVLARSRGYNPARLLSLFNDSAVPKARLEEILSERMGDISPRAIMSILTDVGKDARAVIVRVLETHANETIVEEAIPLLQHPDWWIRLHMVRLVGNHATPEGIAGAIQLLKDENRGVRFEAVKTLGRLKAGEAVTPLCQALRDVDLKVHTAAIDALLAIGDASAVLELVEVLKDESEYARRGAVEVLNELATTDAIKDLVVALRDVDWWVRVRAADALGTLGGERVVDAILELLSDPDDFIRRYAVEILNTVTNPRAVDPLIRKLDDADWWVRERSIDALAKIGDARAVEPLVDLLYRDAQAAPICVRALKDIGDPRAVEPLCRLAGSANEEVRREALEALTAFSRRNLDPATRAEIMAALESTGCRVEGAVRAPMPVRGRHGVADPEFGRAEVAAMATGPSGRRDTPARRGGGDASPVPGSGGAPGDGEPAPRPAEAAPRNQVNLRELTPGDRLADRYKVIRRIGGGGFGTVYLVEDQMVKDELILKILSPYLSLDDGMIKRFVQELKLARRITHPNIIRIHDFLDLGGAHAISMEYFPGRDLARVLKSEGAVAPGRGIKLACQVCDALSAAHEKGVIHRDVKPGNVLVGEDDMVKLVDFGLAAVGQQMGSRLTKSGLLIGTPEYMAPEQISGQSVDGRADLYSLGVLMYEMFSGVQPFAGDNTVAILFQHLEGEIKPLSEVAPQVSPELERVVMAAMARNADDRPATAAELRGMLSGVPPEPGQEEHAPD